jgi:hypothetical protein
MSNEEEVKLPRLSIQDLPGDDWETRFSKQVARNIAAYKDERKMTTKGLADACNEIYRDPDHVKVATLNGLFAGKRKSIGLAEIMVFARALKVAPILLMVPLTLEKHVELVPGHTLDISDALDYITAADRFDDRPKGNERFSGSSSYDFDGKAFEQFELIVEHKNARNLIIYENALWLAEQELVREFPKAVDVIGGNSQKGFFRSACKSLAIVRMRLGMSEIPLPEIEPVLAEMVSHPDQIEKASAGIADRELINELKLARMELYGLRIEQVRETRRLNSDVVENDVELAESLDRIEGKFTSKRRPQDTAGHESA